MGFRSQPWVEGKLSIQPWATILNLFFFFWNVVINSVPSGAQLPPTQPKESKEVFSILFRTSDLPHCRPNKNSLGQSSLLLPSFIVESAWDKYRKTGLGLVLAFYGGRKILSPSLYGLPWTMKEKPPPQIYHREGQLLGESRSAPTMISLWTARSKWSNTWVGIFCVLTINILLVIFLLSSILGRRLERVAWELSCQELNLSTNTFWLTTITLDNLFHRPRLSL